MASISVRYIVDNVAAAIAFYCEQLDFHLVMHPAPTFAMLDRDELRLVLTAPSSQGGGGQAMPDGTKPEPGGWNRSVIEVTDLADRVELLRQHGVHFRNDIVVGVGGKQILLEDPACNPIELFEPTIREARLADA
jgi:catechol 2,3-dioxygenase-like lactoylglutathione lyase family enzyme